MLPLLYSYFYCYYRPVKTIGFNYWQDRIFWIGYLDEWPDYLTQGMSLEDLKIHLMDLFKDLSS